MTEKPYRPCVVGIFIQNDQVLIAQRADASKAWQFPQGGVEKGETYTEALFREIMEELGCNKFTVVSEHPGLLQYEFPEGMTSKIAKTYRGQKQKWFVCRFDEGCGPDLEKAVDKEFSSFKWVYPHEALACVIGWKQEVYAEALQHFKLT